MNNQIFLIGEAIKAGWEKAKSNVGSFFLIFLSYVVVSGIMGTLSSSAKDQSILTVLITLLSWAVSVFLAMGIVRVSLKILDGGKAEIGDFKASAEQFFRFLLGTILSGVIIFIGFILLIIPGIIFSIRLKFVPYLIIEKNLGPIEAIQRSWAITRKRTWKLFLFLLVCALVELLGFIAILIGLLWAIPTVIVATAFVYRKLENAPAAPEVSAPVAAV